MQQKINKNVQQELPTYKKVFIDSCSKNLELQCHLPTTIYMSRVESSQLLHKDRTRLGKACADL
jgi:hypothetical protein